MPSSNSYTTNANGQLDNPSAPFIINGEKYRTTTRSTLQDGRVTSSAITLEKEVSAGKTGVKDFQDYASTSNGGTNWVTPGSSKSGGGQPLTEANSGLTNAEIKALQPGGNLNKAALNSSTQTVKKAGANPEQTKASVGGKPQSPAKDDQSKSSVDISKTVANTTAGTDKGIPEGDLRYPINLNSKQDYVQFKMLKYSPKALEDKSKEQNNPLKLGGRGERTYIGGTVILPIQSGIMDGNSVGWGDDHMNAVDLFKVNVMKSAIYGGFTEAADTAGAGADQVASDFSSEKSSIANAIAQAATGKNVLARAEGAIVNDNVELLFTGVNLRTFTFTFKLSAREDSEAKRIANIIRFFKQGMAAKRTDSSYFLKSPNTFEIKYMHDGKDHPGMNRIKECALQTMSVNYTPDGYYAAHADGYLVTYDITMQFGELEPVYNDEYADFKDTIGY